MDGYEIALMENYPCEDKAQLELRESYWQRQIKCVNKNIAGRTIKEWYQDNKDEINAKQKEYHQKNKDKLNAKHKEYNQEGKC